MDRIYVRKVPCVTWKAIAACTISVNVLHMLFEHPHRYTKHTHEDFSELFRDVFVGRKICNRNNLCVRLILFELL